MLLQKLQIQFHNVLPIFLSIPAKNLIKIRCLEQKKAIMTPRFPPMPHAMPIDAPCDAHRAPCDAHRAPCDAHDAHRCPMRCPPMPHAMPTDAPCHAHRCPIPCPPCPMPCPSALPSCPRMAKGLVSMKLCVWTQYKV